MVRVVTSVGNNGLSDWLLQRVSAILMAIYVGFLIVYFSKHPHPSYNDWKQLFANGWVQVATFLMILSLVLHAWIGLWIVSTDYLKKLSIRLIFQVVVIFLLFASLIWSIEILWRL